MCPYKWRHICTLITIVRHFIRLLFFHNSLLTSLSPLQTGLARCQAITGRCQFPQASDRLWQGQYQASDPAKTAETHQQPWFHTWEGLCWFHVKHSDTSGISFGAGLRANRFWWNWSSNTVFFFKVLGAGRATGKSLPKFRLWQYGHMYVTEINNVDFVVA